MIVFDGSMWYAFFKIRTPQILSEAYSEGPIKGLMNIVALRTVRWGKQLLAKPSEGEGGGIEKKTRRGEGICTMERRENAI